MKKSLNALCFILFLVVSFFVLSFNQKGLEADSGYVGDSEENQILISNYDDFKRYMEYESTYYLKITANIKYINEAVDGEFSTIYKFDGITIKGNKYVDLNGKTIEWYDKSNYSISGYNPDYDTYIGNAHTMISIPKGTKLVINDSGSGGTMFANGRIEDIMGVGQYQDETYRNLFDVYGRKSRTYIW